MALSAAAEVDSPEGDFLTATAMSACVPTMSTFAGRFDFPPSSAGMRAFNRSVISENLFDHKLLGRKSIFDFHPKFL